MKPKKSGRLLDANLDDNIEIKTINIMDRSVFFYNIEREISKTTLTTFIFKEYTG